MTPEVNITITGIQTDEDGEEYLTELTVPGKYREKDGQIILTYDEKDPDEGELVRTTLTAKDFSVNLSRIGAIRSRMFFAVGQLHPGVHITSYGVLELQVHTEDVKILFGETKGQIFLRYTLYCDGELLTRCKMTIRCSAVDPA